MAKLMSKEVEWKRLLLTIAQNLTKKNVNDIIFLKQIEDGIAEELSHDGLKTLMELERRKIISHSDPTALLQLLSDIKKHNLKKFVKDFQSKFKEGGVENKLRNNNSVLRMKASPRGICLILSNEKFGPFVNGKDGNVNKGVAERPNSKTACQAPNQYDRPGTLADEKALEETFTWLGFEVRLEKNHTACEMYQILSDIAKEDHSKYDAFVCCILSHGGKHLIHGTDWGTLKIVDICGLFNGQDCDTLAKKPKIFFVQACRGKGIDVGLKKLVPTESSEGFTHQNDSGSTGQGFDFSHTENNTDKGICWPEADLASGRHTFDDGLSDQQRSKVSEQTAYGNNILFVYASVEGYKAILDDQHGSWLITSVCTIFQQNARDCDLDYMLHQVQQQISAKVSKLGGRYKTTLELDGSLDYTEIYFEPPMAFDEYRKQNVKVKAANE